MDIFLFYLFAGFALAGAIGVIAFRRVFYSAISLIACLGALAALYLLLNAPFIAAVQIIVYAGAIMVLFLFVIMLLDPFSGGQHSDKKKYLGVLGVLLSGFALVLLVPMLRTYDLTGAPRNPLVATGGDWNSITVLAKSLFHKYLLPFEVTSVLILVAIIGAVVLAKRQR
jgi:NADH-quinone oxidoreductase subunit J